MTKKPETPQTPATESAVEDTPAAEPTKSDVAVDAWLDEHIRNGPLAQHTPAWNELIEKLPLLKEALNKEDSGNDAV